MTLLIGSCDLAAATNILLLADRPLTDFMTTTDSSITGSQKDLTVL